jgi:hypothetical protein
VEDRLSQLAQAGDRDLAHPVVVLDEQDDRVA